MNFFFIIDSITIYLLITGYHLNLFSDLMQAPTEHGLLKFSDILKLFDQKKDAIATFMDLSEAFDWIIIFYYLNSNDMAPIKLHCNGSIVIRP